MSQSTLLNLRRFTLFVLLVAFTGCGRIAFVSERYDNFTAYYNTFYNAEKSYTEGVEALEQTEQAIDRQIYISIFEAPGQNSNNQKFQAAIDKSADVLREHPDSKWVDDALLLIGKSYFYQQNYVGAEQKFREAMEMDTPLEDEARLWLARTLIASGAHDEAREHLLVSLNRDDLSRRWEPSLRLALGELHVKRADYDAAIEELAAGLEDVRDNRYRARAAFLLGQVYETVGRYEDAVEAYDAVQDAHPRYELSYAALYSAVRVQGLRVDAEEALRNLRRMERDDKNYSNRYELAFLRGRIYQAQEYAGDARELYHEILYDSEAQITDLRGRVHYALGELYRDAYRDYQMASAHFDTARTALRPPAAGTGGRRTQEIDYAPEAITDAEELSVMFGSFADVRMQLAEMDSLLYIGSLDDDEFVAKIREIRQQMAKEIAEEEARAARLQAERGFQNAATAGGAGRSPGSADAATAASSSAGFLYHRDPVRAQEGRMSFIDRWGDRPLATNWRRIEAIQGVASTTDAAGRQLGQRMTDLDPSVGSSPLPPLDYSNVPRDSLTRAAMRARRAVARYELANVLFLAMDRPDSAATWYRTVIEEDAEFPVAQRAFYALAEVHSSLGDSSAARRLYEQVLEDYPSSDFAGRVRERLGIREDVPSDTLALAEEEYGQAYQRWRRGSYQRAIDHMVEVAAAYPGLEVAPRALLAAGRIYLEWAHRDSLDLFGPIPLTVPDTTLERAGLLGLTGPESAPAGETPAGKTQPAGKTPAGQAAPAGKTPPGDPSVEAGAPSRDPAPAQTPPANAPPNDRSGVVPLFEEDVPPPGKGRAGEVPRKGEAAEAPDGDRAVVNAPPRRGERRADSTAAQQRPDILIPIRDTEIVARNPAPADTLDTAGEAPPAPADTLVTAGEAPSDPADTLVTAGAVPARPADTLAAADSSALNDAAASMTAGDSTAVAAVDTAAAGLIAAAIEDDDIYLKTLYAGVKQNYPETAYAKQADVLMKALLERESELKAVADSLSAIAAAAADSAAGLFAAEGILADSLGMGADSLGFAADSLSARRDLSGASDTTATTEAAAPSDTTATTDATAPSDTTATTEAAAISDTAAAADNAERAEDALAEPESAIPTGEDAIRGEGGIRPELGGYTLIIGRDSNEATMRALARKYADRGFRTDVVIERAGGETFYRAAIGHFTSQQTAGVLLQKYLTDVEEAVHLAPLSDFE